MMFKSEPHGGYIYIAEPVREGSTKLKWSIMHVHEGADFPCSAKQVPRKIRYQAYAQFPEYKPKER